MPQENNDRILRWPQVAKITGISRSNCWRLIKRQAFPKSLKLSERAVGWRKSEIDAWVASRSNAH